jgi:hypothetical protein
MDPPDGNLALNPEFQEQMPLETQLDASATLAG